MTTHRLLSVALALQAGLAVITWWPTRGAAPAEPRALVPLEADAVTAIEITGRAADGEIPDPVRLERGDTGWTVTSLHGYPADEAKVADLLEDLVGLQVRAPIATQPTSHAALEVAEDAFTRRVRLESASGTIELYLGAGRGQTAHVRRGDEAFVHAARGISAWSVADAGRSWIDTGWVDVDRAQLATFGLSNANGAFELEKGADGWTVVGGEQALDADAVDELLRDLLRLRIRSVAAAEAEAGHGLDGTVRVSWSLASGSGGAYEVGAVEDGRAYARQEGRPHVVELSASAVRPALDTRLEDLLAGEPEAP